MQRNHRFTKVLLASGFPLVTGQALAGSMFESGNVSGELTFGAGAVFIDSHHVNFGTGKVDLRNGENDGDKISWQEYYVKPGVTLKYKVNEDFDVLAGGSFMGTTTFGDGDAGGNTRSSDGRGGIEEAYVGFRSGEWTVTAGRQLYKIGTGFIVMDGNLDTAGDGALWMNPRLAFRDTGIVAWNHGDLQAQVFTIRTDSDWGDFCMSGANLDYSVADQVTLGFAAMKVDSLISNAEAWTPRDGMQVYNARALNAKIPGVPQLVLNTEYAVQRGSGDHVDYDADAWYFQADYTIDNLPLTPTLGYRYSHFSGDDDLSDNKNKTWDPLTKGFVDWGTWLIGDVTGNYLLFNSNQNVHQFSLRSKLSDTVAAGAIRYKFWLDEKNFHGQEVSQKRFGDETTFFVDWTPTPEWYVSLSYSWVDPKAAAKEAFGDDEKFNALQLYTVYHY